MSQFHLPPINQGGSPMPIRGNYTGTAQMPVTYGNNFDGGMMQGQLAPTMIPRNLSQPNMSMGMGIGGGDNSYASFKLYEKMREEKIMAVLERQAEYLAKIATKFKIFQDNSNQRLRDRIFELEKENEILQRKRREEHLLGQINNSLDNRFRNYNESQLKGFLDGNGNGSFIQPMSLDPEEFNKLFRSPREIEEDGEVKKKKKKTRGKSKKKKPAS